MVVSNHDSKDSSDGVESPRPAGWCVQSLRDLARALGLGGRRRRNEAERAATDTATRERIAAHQDQQCQAAIAARAVRDRGGSRD